jgi:hypothetical protein
MWLMIGTAFLSQPPGLPPQTKPLNLSKEFCPLSLAFDFSIIPLQIGQDQEKEPVIFRLLWVVSLGYPFSLLAKAPYCWDYGPMPSTAVVHRPEGPKIEFQFSKLFYFQQIPRVFKIKMSVYQVMALAKRQKGSFLDFCYRPKKIF